MIYLKADTNVRVLVGPAVAVGDGFTPVTSLTLSGADEAELIKYNGDTALAVTDISANTFGAITSADGYYSLQLTAAQLDTEGFAVVVINDDSLILPLRHEFMVVNANVYDALFAAAATDFLQVDVEQIDGGNVPVPAVTGVPDVNITHIQDGAVPTPAATGVPDVNVTHWDDATPAGANMADDVWDELLAGHLGVGSVGEFLQKTNTLAVQKNVALANFPFVMYDANGNPATGLTVVEERSIDGAAFAACANAFVEIGNGAYQIDLAASDLNGDTILLRFSTAGSERDTFVTIVTHP